MHYEMPVPFGTVNGVSTLLGSMSQYMGVSKWEICHNLMAVNVCNIEQLHHTIYGI